LYEKRKSDPGKNYLLPFTQGCNDINPDMEQNAGYNKSWIQLLLFIILAFESIFRLRYDHCIGT
jgi:hypothetical protein